MKDFLLPDLGEGLQDAEIREWHAKVGDHVTADQLLLSVETDKAVVDVPAPRTGIVGKLHGNPGDRIAVGAPLMSYADDAPGSGATGSGATAGVAIPPPTSTTAAPDDTFTATPAAQAPSPTPATAAPAEAIRDTGVVVGAMTSSDTVVKEGVTSVGTAGGLKVAPAVRALASRLNVDLTVVTPSGPDGTITAADVQRVHKLLTEVGPLERLRGLRRAMALSMSQSRDEITPTSLFDDAVLAWYKPGADGKKPDITLRLIRALTVAVKEQPALNAWFDHQEIGRRLLEKVHLGMAVDTPEGLIVGVMQDVGARSDDSLREGLSRLKADAVARTVPADQLRGFTITLSNFGRFGGRYATPVIVPPTVAIVAAGAVRDGVVAVGGEARVLPVLPLSLTFDHRAVTGGEAARFLAALIKAMEKDTV